MPCQAGGNAALAVMDEYLACTSFFVGSKPTIADISLYAYTRVAGDGGFDLTRYKNILRWFADIEAIPGYMCMLAVTA
jgi:glutathione S-transferase